MAGMKNRSGGKREGAGRPPRKLADASGERTLYPDAEAYLAAVVEGREPPDPVRVQAAKTLILYQKPKARAPVKSPRPTELASRESLVKQNDAADDFNEKARVIRAKHAAKGKLQ